MTTYTLNPEILANLESGAIRLDKGAHDSFDGGHCAMEVVAALAGLGHTDAPECASPVLQRFTIRLNDGWDDKQRQSLIPFLPRMVGTAGDGKDDAREQAALRFLLERLLGPWLRLAGMGDEADQTPAILGLPYHEQRRVVNGWYDKAWQIRWQNRDRLKAKIIGHLTSQGKPAAAAAAADVAVAAAAAADVAAADAAAAAAAAAADVAAAAAADVADASSWKRYDAAYAAARKYYAEHPEALQPVTDLAAEQKGAALELLEILIDPTEVAGGLA